MDQSFSKNKSHILFYGLLFIITLEYLRLGTYIPVITAVKGYTVIPLSVFIFSLLSNVGNSSSNIIFKAFNSKILLFFILLLVTSAAIYGSSNIRLQIISGTIGYYFLFFIISKQVNNIHRSKILIITLILCHIVLIFQNIEVISNPSTRSYITKGAAFLGDGNDFALSICILIPLCVYLLITEKNTKLRLLFFVSLIILILTVIGTQSRGGSLALFCVFLYLGLKSKKKAAFLRNLFFVLFIIVLYAPPVYFSRLENVNNYQEASAQGRVNAWKAAIRMANDYPLVGVGVGEFPFRYAFDYWEGEYSSRPKTAHSMYFLALGELGYPGVVLLLYFIYSNFRTNERYIRKLMTNEEDSGRDNLIALLKFTNCSLIGFAIAGTFLSVLYYPHIFLIAGIMDSTRNIVNREFPECETK